ncbi:MAG: hypothetical protein D6763_09785 [Alphaproteobacteria bacterium]|nr:MAG: hypothetical protein D6763_09785 [Alphaproteobacteria bacterium]
MKLKDIIVTILGACAMLGATFTVASAAPLNSGPGSASCELNSNLFVDTSCTLEAITPHRLWQSNNPDGSDAVWVSYANTGIGGDTLAPTSKGDWVMKITETFHIGPNGGSIQMKVWADDTAGIYLNGNLMAAPQFGQNVCADKPVGCEPDEFYFLDELLSAGTHTIEIYGYQVGTGKTVDSNPFGVLYAGSITGEVPAPPALTLFGLAGLGLLARRRAAAQR